MQCPKCQADVAVGASECPSCGVILSKASTHYVRPPVPQTLPPSPSKSATPAVIKLAIAVAAVWFVWHFFSVKPVSAAGWYEGARGYQQAMAERNGKPVMVYFHTTWCGYCKRLDRDVFASSDFAHRYGASMLKVSINPEAGHDEYSIARQYGIHGFPTVFVVASERTSAPIVGYRDAETFYASLDSAVQMSP